MRPTISRSQAPRAAVSTLTWPGCRMSKQPLVKPMRSPCLRHSARCASRSPPAGTIFSSAASDACGRIFRRNSGRRHGGGALLADRDRRRRIRHPQRGLPIGPGRERQRQRGGDRVARAGDVAHLDRQRRHVDRLAAANHQRHAVFALRHQHGLAVGEIPSRPAPRRQCSGRYRRGCGWLRQIPCGWASAAWRRDRSRNWRSWDRRSRACRASCAASMTLRITRAVSTPLA